MGKSVTQGWVTLPRFLGIFTIILVNLMHSVSSNAQNNNILQDPGNMSAYRQYIGITYPIWVTGTDQGSIWGGADGVYTDDSRLAKAAVHAGLLKVGEQKVVYVTMLRGAPQYFGSTNNGVTSLGYGSFSGSYKFESATSDGLRKPEPIISGEIMDDPGNLVKLRNNNGITYTINLTGTDKGSVWGGGDGIYTDDSSLGKAAVHAGFLKPGQQGIVRVTILPGAQRYLGSTRNGIITNHYGPFAGSFRFESAQGITNQQNRYQEQLGQDKVALNPYASNSNVNVNNEVITNPGNLIKFRKNTGMTYSVQVTGTLQGGVWGGADGVYTDDSAVAKAAVHSGLIEVGETKVLKVTILPGRQWYNGCSRNGITTPNFGSFAGSYRFEPDNEGVISPQEEIGRKVMSDPGNLIKFRGNIGEVYLIQIVGTNQGGVWGGADGIYTDDSAVAKASVHAGLVKIGEQAIVKVKIMPGMQRYTGSPANGITTTNFGPFPGSFTFLQ